MKEGIIMKTNKKEKEMLKERGWEYAPYVDEAFGKVERYTFDVDGYEWSLSKGRELAGELIDAYKNGSRICIMTPCNYMAKWILENTNDGGIWLCPKIEDAFNYFDEEVHYE